MQTFIKKTVKILFFLLIFVSLYDKIHAQSTTTIELPVTTDPALILSGVPWQVPAKVAKIKIQAWGGGGGGGGGAMNSGDNAGGGGGGGAYLEFTKTSGLSGTWYYVVGLGADAVANRGKVGEASWINFIDTSHPIAGPNGLQAGRGDGGGKPDNKAVLGGIGGNAADLASSFFPTSGGTGGNIIDGQNGSSSTASSSGKGGNSGNGGNGGASVSILGAAGNNGSYPGGGGSGVGPYLNKTLDQIGGKGGDGRIILTITHIDAPTASSQTLCTGSTISDLVTSNTLTGATIKWYDQASGGTALIATTLLTNKTYYATQTYNEVESDRKAVIVTVSSTPGSISGAVPVCTGTNSTLLTLSGNIGNVQWQSSVDGTNYTNIASATAQTYTASNLTSTTYYKAVVKSGTCASVTTSAAAIQVKQAGSWIGTASTDWNNAGNWCGSIPNASTDVTISNEPSNQPSIGSANATVRNLTITPGASVSITSNMTLNVWGDWTNNGTFTATSGSINFKKVGDQAIGGANISTFNNISFDGGGSKAISKDVVIKGEVTFTSGYITSANNSKLIFNVGSSVATGVANNASFAKVVVVKYGATPFEFPIGGLINSVNKYRPIAISNLINTSDTSNFYAEHIAINPLLAGFKYGFNGTSTVLYKNEFTQTLTNLSTLEYWNLSRSDTNSTASVTMDFSQFPTTEPNAQFLRMGHYNAVDSYWENAPTTNASGTRSFDFATKKLTVQNVNNFSPLAIGATQNTALPVVLTSFTAKPTSISTVALNWATSTEIVNKGFRIERQAGGVNGKFESIGFVASKAVGGNSQNALYYNFIDESPRSGAAAFYRLAQEDLDGKTNFSEVRVVKLNGETVSMVFPNPSTGAVNISRTANGKKMNIQVIDISGRIIQQYTNITDSNFQLKISKSGVYNIKMTYPETGKQSVQRIIIEN